MLSRFQSSPLWKNQVQSFCWKYSILYKGLGGDLVYLSHLLKQFLLLFVPTTGIHNDEILLLCFELFHTLLGDDGRVCLGVAAIKRNLGFCCILLQLIKGTCNRDSHI